MSSGKVTETKTTQLLWLLMKFSLKFLALDKVKNTQMKISKIFDKFYRPGKL